MALRLYDVFWSHFCEKARWCLDFKRLPYVLVRVDPYTRRQVKALGARGKVPVLVDGDRVVEGSDAIAAHLEAICPAPPLLPADEAGRAEVLAIQKRCDEVLGPDSRRLAYEAAFACPALLEGTILWSRPPKRWLNGLWLRIVEPRMRALFSVHPEEVERSRKRLRDLLAGLQRRLAGRAFLVGETLTLADITAVSLMDPLEIVPEFVREASFAPIFDWRRRLALEHGRRRRIPWVAGDRPSGLLQFDLPLPGPPPRQAGVAGRPE